MRNATKVRLKLFFTVWRILGIAQALLHNPELIILDEPTTGLDPQGMKEIRDLILRLSKEENKTIFLSSHILYEVEMVAKRMIIINKGAKIVEGEVKELLNLNKLQVTFEVDNVERARNILSTTNWINDLDSYEDGRIIFNLEDDQIAGLNKYLVENEVAVSAVIPKRSLEEYFLNIIDKEV